MTLFNCFRKSSKAKSWKSSSSFSSPSPSIATPQISPAPFDSITPVDAPPVYTPTNSDAKFGEIYPVPAISFPTNTIPRTFSNNVGPVPQSCRPPSVTSFASSALPPDSGVDDEYGSLRDIDTVILIDDSGSMSVNDCRSVNGTRTTRWEETRTALEGMLPIVTKRDPDGVDVYFLNHKSRDLGDKSEGKAGTGYRNITSVKKVKSLFATVRPTGVTPTGQRIRDILTPYVNHVADMTKRNTAVKKLNILCITDGVATDNLEEDIVEFAKKLDDLGAIARQVGIQFFQVGHDLKATEALKELDDDLVDLGVRDMVDTTTFGKDGKGNKSLDGDVMIKFVLGGVNGRQDKKNLPRRT